jgi:hypothetical protein
VAILAFESRDHQVWFPGWVLRVGVSGWTSRWPNWSSMTLQGKLGQVDQERHRWTRTDGRLILPLPMAPLRFALVVLSQGHKDAFEVWPVRTAGASTGRRLPALGVFHEFEPDMPD